MGLGAAVARNSRGNPGHRHVDGDAGHPHEYRRVETVTTYDLHQLCVYNNFGDGMSGSGRSCSTKGAWRQRQNLHQDFVKQRWPTAKYAVRLDQTIAAGRRGFIRWTAFQR